MPTKEAKKITNKKTVKSKKGIDQETGKLMKGFKYIKGGDIVRTKQRGGKGSSKGSLGLTLNLGVFSRLFGLNKSQTPPPPTTSAPLPVAPVAQVALPVAPPKQSPKKLLQIIIDSAKKNADDYNNGKSIEDSFKELTEQQKVDILNTIYQNIKDKIEKDKIENNEIENSEIQKHLMNYATYIIEILQQNFQISKQQKEILNELEVIIVRLDLEEIKTFFDKNKEITFGFSKGNIKTKKYNDNKGLSYKSYKYDDQMDDNNKFTIIIINNNRILIEIIDKPLTTFNLCMLSEFIRYVKEDINIEQITVVYLILNYNHVFYDPNKKFLREKLEFKYFNHNDDPEESKLLEKFYVVGYLSGSIVFKNDFKKLEYNLNKTCSPQGFGIVGGNYGKKNKQMTIKSESTTKKKTKTKPKVNVKSKAKYVVKSTNKTYKK